MKAIVIVEIHHPDDLTENGNLTLAEGLQQELKDGLEYASVVSIIEPDEIDPNDKDLGAQIREKL